MEYNSEMKQDTDSIHLHSVIMQKIIQTAEFKHLLNDMIPFIAKGLSGPNWFSRMISNGLERILHTGFGWLDLVPSDKKINDLAEDPEISNPHLFNRIPIPVNFFVRTIQSMGNRIEKLTNSDKEKLIGNVLARFDFPTAGQGFSTWIRIVNMIHEQNPTFYSDHLYDAIHHLIDKIDFGEVKEFFDGAADDYLALVKRLNDVMWEYPAKVVILFSYAPSLFNIATSIVHYTIQKFNRVSPDLAADIILSIVKEIKISQVSNLINECTELLRKLHTGSALLGEAGHPAITNEINKIYFEILQNIDSSTLKKAIQAINEFKEAIDNAKTSALESQPELALVGIKNHFEIHNMAIRSLVRKAMLMESLPNDDVVQSLINGFSDLSITELAEVINIGLMMIQDIHDQKPDLFQHVISQMMNSLDWDQVQDVSEWLMKDIGYAMAPLITKGLPHFIQGFYQAVQSEDNGLSDFIATIKPLLNEMNKPSIDTEMSIGG